MITLNVLYIKKKWIYVLLTFQNETQIMKNKLFRMEKDDIILKE